MRIERLRVPVQDLRAAFEFLTIFPVPRGEPARSLGASMFPVVGLFLAIGALGVDAMFSVAPPALGAVAIIAFWALTTGAFHYDALADALDGLGGGSREERLEIMRDSSVGAFGVLGLILAVATKLGALESLSDGARVRGLLLAPVLGRWAMILTAFHMPAARSEGLGAAFASKLEPRDMVFATLACIVVLFPAGRDGGLALAATLLLVVGMRRLARDRFGGITGDVLGASGEIVETLVLAVLAAGQGG